MPLPIQTYSTSKIQLPQRPVAGLENLMLQSRILDLGMFLGYGDLTNVAYGEMVFHRVICPSLPEGE